LFEEVLFRGALQNLLSRWKYNSYLYIFFAAVLAMSAKAIWLKSINPWVFYGVLIVLVLLLLRSRAVTDLLNRVTNHYALPIILTAILFSLVHASWYGFIPRLVLGLVLGLLFYRTNNILYAIIVHFFNNAAVVTIMFIAALQNKPVTNAEEQGFPWWLGIISLGVVFFLFNRLAKQPNISGPDEITDDRSNPFKKAIPENNPEE
jgi:membrane protease YdiL (CAAX protease family)